MDLNSLPTSLRVPRSFNYVYVVFSPIYQPGVDRAPPPPSKFPPYVHVLPWRLNRPRFPDNRDYDPTKKCSRATGDVYFYRV
ncbi:hypothetical protein FA95DRAFT_1563912 [Auriscalpium vulgare]|uniref:Uncharacterized protein n=1 Tax=Auriscalpium vulgare TaxID=40419 RepID=A0ACB8RFC9_9AGAM|nr:hypothetical protein FA95DRAFT_1563912 [Auriscalpium vulgare]